MMPNTPTNSAQAEFDHALSIWKCAQVIYEGPTRGTPEAWSILQNISARPDDFHDLLVATLAHSSQLAVGYSLLALAGMKSPMLDSLPPELLSRRDKITMLNGSFSYSMDLGGLARRLCKK